MIVKRKRLPRGVKPTVRQVFGSAADDEGVLATTRDLRDSEVGVENLQTGLGTFTVHFSWPLIDSDICNYQNTQLGGVPGVCVPFLLPPLQEFWRSATQSEPSVRLEEILYSFDQRSEPVVTASPYQGVDLVGPPVVLQDARSGRMHFDEGQRLEASIVIWEKIPVKTAPPRTDLYARYALMQHENYQPLWVPDAVLHQVDLPFTLFLGQGRVNPFVQTGIGKQIDPYKTYMVGLMLPALAITGGFPRDDFALVNVHLALKFTHPLVRTPWRDSGDILEWVQNRPKEQKEGVVIVDSVPAAGAVITADGTTGISTALSTLDREVRRKLKGGLSRRSLPPGVEALREDSTYDVVCVPLYANPHNGMIKNAVSVSPPAGAAGNFSGSPVLLPNYVDDMTKVESRRIFPLPFPMEIHHAFAMVNWQKTAEASDDAQEGVSHDIGIGMSCGAVADHAADQQIGRLQFVQKWGAVGGNAVSRYLIDRWTYPWNRSAVSPSARFDGSLAVFERNVSWEIYQIPLVFAGAGPFGNGYDLQGNPVFAGQGQGTAAGTFSATRTGIAPSVGGGAEVTPACRGGEQWIDVRWQMNADDPYNQGAPSPGWTNLTAGQTLVGYGGFFVILLGRKWLTSGKVV